MMIRLIVIAVLVLLALVFLLAYRPCGIRIACVPGGGAGSYDDDEAHGGKDCAAA